MKTHSNTYVFKLSVFVLSICCLPVFRGEAGPPRTDDTREQKASEARELLNKATELLQLTSWDLAIDYYQEVLKLFPDYHQARFGIGMCYECKQNKEKAVAQYRLVANAKNAPESLDPRCHHPRRVPPNSDPRPGTGRTIRHGHCLVEKGR